MGHRTLVAVEIASGRYALGRVQWGGELLDCDDRRLAARATRLVAERDPPVTKCDARAVLDAVKPFSDELLVIVDSQGRPTRFLVCSLSVPIRRDPTGVGRGTSGQCVLVEVPDGDAARQVRIGRRTLDGGLGDAVDAGLLPTWLAAGYVGHWLASHPDTVGAPIWLATRVAAH